MDKFDDNLTNELTSSVIILIIYLFHIDKLNSESTLFCYVQFLVHAKC